MEKVILGNRYELLEKIAEGGMSTIYKAYCNTLNRIVAVKILKQEFSRDSGFLMKFNNEAKAAASLNHPNIISIYDVGKDGDIAYIVMEFVDGINLKQLIRQRGPIGEKEALQIVRQICLALKEAHSHGIVHRDIKPHNIMINSNNVVKVGDFGIARASSSATITTGGAVMGSVHYFSPEQARGSYMDERSDIYSLGVMLYELVIGRPPYDGDTPVNVALKHIQENVTIPREFINILSPSVIDMILKMTQKDMIKRYPNVDQIIRDIDKIILGENINLYTQAQEDMDSTKIIKMPKSVKEKLNSKQEHKNIKTPKKKHTKAIIISSIMLLILLALIVLVLASTIFPNGNTVVIPNVIHDSVLEAQKELEKNGLTLKIMSEKEDPEFKEGTIITQNPEAGLKIRKGEEISVVVAKELENNISVPNVSGKDIDTAKKMIEAAKLKVDVDYEFASDVEKDNVISQYPKSDEKVRLGDVVKIKVSKGEEIIKVKVPNFVGISYESAKESLDGFAIGNISYKEDETKKDGYVIYQNPQAGQEVDAKTKIDLVINKLPKKEKPEDEKKNNDTTKPVSQSAKDVSKTITLVLPKKEQLTLSVVDKQSSMTVYSGTISTMDDPNKNITVTAKEGQNKKYEIYIDGEYYATTGDISF